ncbi:serine hydrolase [Streptomyces avermitilis]
MAFDLDTGRIHRLLQAGVRDKVYPGAVWAIGDSQGTHVSGTAGVLDPAQPDEPMRHDTVFDVASLTKILAVCSTIGALVEDGKLQLDAEMGDFWPEVSGCPLAPVTVSPERKHTRRFRLRTPNKGGGLDLVRGRCRARGRRVAGRGQPRNRTR